MDRRNVAVFRDVNDKILHITEQVRDITITEQVGNIAHLNFTIINVLPPFFSQDVFELAETVTVYDQRLGLDRKFKILTQEKEFADGKLTEMFECLSLNYAKFENQYVKVVLPQAATLATCLTAVMTRAGYYDFGSMIGIVQEDSEVGLTEEKEFAEVPLIEVLTELQKIFNRYLIISDDCKVNFLSTVGKSVDVNYKYGGEQSVGGNYKRIKQRIDKSKVVQRVVGRGKITDNIAVTFTNINGGKDYLQTGGWAENDGFTVYQDLEETSKQDLLRKTQSELDKYKKPIKSYELETSFIMVDASKDINELFRVGDIIKLYNPYFGTKGIEQKVCELTYNPFFPWSNPSITLGEKQTQLVEFLQDAAKQIDKIKRTLTS